MSINEQAFSLLLSPLYSVKEHFDKIIEKALGASTRSGREIRILTHFLSSVHGFSQSFEEQMFKNCEEFQKNTKENVSDEQTAHSYQMVINSILRFSDGVHRFNLVIKESKDSLAEMERQAKSIQNTTVNMIANSTSDLKTAIAHFENDYRKSMRTAAIPFLPKDQQPSGVSAEPMVMKALEDAAQSSFEKVRAQFANNLNCFQLKLETLSLQETEGKNTACRISEKVSRTVKTLYNRDSSAKAETTGDLGMEKNSFFDRLKRDLLLEFNKDVKFASLRLNFVPSLQFLKLSVILDAPYPRHLAIKVRELTPKIPVRIRIYCELFFEYFYRTNEDFSKEVIEELQTILAERNTRDYFVALLLLKKTIIFQTKPMAPLSLLNLQFQNLELIAQSVLLACLKDPSDLDLEHCLTFLKFASTVLNEQKQLLIEKCSRLFNFASVEFWIRMFDFLVSKNLNGLIEYRSMAPIETKFFSGLKNIMNDLTGQTNVPRSEVRTKAFDEVSSLIFRLGLGFDVISEVLLSIAQAAEVSFDSIKSTLLRNQDLLAQQIINKPEFRIDTRPIFDKLTKFPTRNHRFTFVLPKAVQFLDSTQDIVSLMLLNKHTYGKHEVFLKEVLLNFQFAQHSAIRKHIIALKIDPGTAVEFLLEPTDLKNDSIINLDVKRTISYDKGFKPDSLRRILANVSSEDMGSFSYYQGLNYIATYFLPVMNNDEVKTYNFLVSILYAYFSPYVDQDLRNIKKLFFYLKNFMKVHLPVLHHFLETEQKLNSDILFASWCLTLFTQVTQYVEYSPWLDEIIDIFLSKGWPGFFRVILVILDELQDKIFRMNYEDTLMMLSELCKTNFREVVKASAALNETVNDSLLVDKTASNPSGFSFKKKIRKFRGVNKYMMICYQCQYLKLEEKLGDFWARFNKRVKASEKQSSKGNLGKGE